MLDSQKRRWRRILRTEWWDSWVHAQAEGLSVGQQDRLDVIVSERKSQFTPAEVEEFCAEFDDIDSILGRLEQATKPKKKS
ncbi:hypothetical protein GQ600_25036 [Phytophthora cactorum]|nr:hypothetical protein GQ600_25036 [Phytophthora cactorum]